MIDIFIWILLGILAGIVAGLTPGIHVNLISVGFVSVSSLLFGFASEIALGTFITAMAVTFVFVSFIPSVFLGAPDADNCLSVLPGHRMLLKGQGHQAIKLSIAGALTALMLCIPALPVLIFAIPFAYRYLQDFVGWILLFIIMLMIFAERSLYKKFWSFVVFILSGILGLIVLRIPNFKEPLLPMLSGIFGISILIMSLSNKTKVPEQNVHREIRLGAGNLLKVMFSSLISGCFVLLFPGLGPNQAAVIGGNIFGKLKKHCFLALVGGVNAVNMLVSLVTLYTIEKPRNGAIVALSKIVDVDFNILVFFVLCTLAVAGIAAICTLWLSKCFARLIPLLNYKALGIAIIIFLCVLSFYFSGKISLPILFTGTAIGIIPSIAGVRKSFAMGCILLPIILWTIL